MRNTRILVMVLATLGLSVLVAACGGDGDNDTDTSGDSPAAAETEATTGAGGELVKGPPEQPGTEIQELPPLPKPPPKGLNVVQLQCDFPACVPFAETFKEASKALGWNLKTIVFKTGQPQSAMTQALETPGVEYITMAGVARALIEPQMKVAQEKDIQVISCCNSDPPAPAENYPVQISMPQEGNQVIPATEAARWMINDSEGTANVAIVGLPENPSTQPGPPTIEKTFEEECPDCKAEEIPVTGEELASGTTAGKVVAFLQAHPDVDYVHFIFGDLMAGAPEAIKAAGLEEKVKLSGQSSLEGEAAKLMKEGRIDGWYVGGQGEWGYLWADAIARLAGGGELPQDQYAKSPAAWLCTPATAEECIGWGGVEDFGRQYLELWGLE